MRPSAKPFALGLASAQTASPIPPSIATPGVVESRIGTLEFTDGMASQETLGKVVQQEPAGALGPELMGSIVAIGIIRGRRLCPQCEYH